MERVNEVCVLSDHYPVFLGSNIEDDGIRSSILEREIESMYGVISGTGQTSGDPPRQLSVYKELHAAKG